MFEGPAGGAQQDGESLTVAGQKAEGELSGDEAGMRGAARLAGPRLPSSAVSGK